MNEFKLHTTNNVFGDQKASFVESDFLAPSGETSVQNSGTKLNAESSPIVSGYIHASTLEGESCFVAVMYCQVTSDPW